MACTHTEMPKFSDPLDGRFVDLWDQLDIVVASALTNAERHADESSVEARFARLAGPPLLPMGSC